MKKLILLILFFVPVFSFTQEDSLKYNQLDSMSYEELQLYYKNEPEPIPFYKGPDTGDSLYFVINPLVVPTETVLAEPLSIHRLKEDEIPVLLTDSLNTIEQRLKPKISIGAGSLSFHGDLYKKRFQSPFTARPAVDLAISQRLNRFLQLDFTFLNGKLGANEWINNRQENFQSEIKAGGVNLLYDFGNFIPDKYIIRPFVSFGLVGFEFLSKTDLKDKNGSTYYYWNDGSIRNKPEDAAGSQNAANLFRDYHYESDIRELNLDGFGKYQERAWAFPIAIGFYGKITDRINMKINVQYFLSTTDYIDGISENSLGNRKGNKQKDNFMYTSLSLQYDLIAKPLKRSAVDTLSDLFWLAFDTGDQDGDGVIDFKDDCAGTPEGAKVDERGCPLDDDDDGIPNFRDDELNTPTGIAVNGRGVGQDDAFWQNWYYRYKNDTTTYNSIIENTENIYAKRTTESRKRESNDYTVELMRYQGSIPAEELSFLLSIGDINSTTLSDGTTVVYTSGNYDNLATAVKRRDEFRAHGSKGAGISKVKGRNIIQIHEDELQTLLNIELEQLLNTKVESVNASDAFDKDDIVYRVQLGAFRNKISVSIFNTSAGVLELKTGENIFRYVTKGYKTIEEAAAVRADLVVQGYSDAFVTAYRHGKRLPLSETMATVDKSYKEDLSEDKMFSSIDKKLILFKVQLGPLKKKTQEATMDEKIMLLADVEKQVTPTGSYRYTTGNFFNYNDAENFRLELVENSFRDAFIIATFKNEIISIQEAMELLK
jgi:hypothetical protein